VHSELSAHLQIRTFADILFLSESQAHENDNNNDDRVKHLMVTNATMGFSNFKLVPGDLFNRPDEVCLLPPDRKDRFANPRLLEPDFLVTQTSKVSLVLIAYTLLLRYYTGSSNVFFGLVNEDKETSSVADFTLHRETPINDLGGMVERASRQDPRVRRRIRRASSWRVSTLLYTFPRLRQMREELCWSMDVIKANK